MGIKKRITKDNYQEVVLKRSIIACWIILIICFAIKLFGGNYFGIVCTNDKFLSICNYIDNSWIAYLLRCISFLLSSFLIFKCIDYGSSKIKTIIFLILSMCVWSYKHLINLGIINVGTLLYNVLDFVSLYIISVVCSSKKNIYVRCIKPIIFIALSIVISFNFHFSYVLIEFLCTIICMGTALYGFFNIYVVIGEFACVAENREKKN